MGDVILWGRASSANVQKAMWALEEAGVAYERKDVGGRFGGLDTPQFGQMNPNRMVPVLQHEGLTLWESHAIVRYVAARFSSGGIWPEDAAERALVDQWTDWTASTFQSAWLGVFWLVVRTPTERHDGQAIADAVKRANAAFSIIESQLERTPFLAGERLTYADIVAGVRCTAGRRWRWNGQICRQWRHGMRG